MNRFRRPNLLWSTVGVAALAFLWGEATSSGLLVLAGGIVLVVVGVVFRQRIWSWAKQRGWVRERGWNWIKRKWHNRAVSSASPSDELETVPATVAPTRSHSRPAEPQEEDLESMVQRMFDEGRFALLLRPQIASTLDAEILAKAQEELDRYMSIVPDGDVHLEPNRLSAAAEFDVPEELLQPVPIHVAVTFLDRYPVTNRQYQAFIDAGGYEQMAIWDPSVWPAVLDFVDKTGKPGPRFWIDGRCPPGKEDHPVVGVCWYEAAAYSRWVGRRLPTDAEWVKAASWPVNIPPATSFQRKYPWGNTMERQRANLWGSGPADTAPIDAFSDGVSVGGVYHLIGNVWEWTADEFLWVATAADKDAEPTLLKTVRGGAFDTYFDNQATSQFASGENPLGRKHNVGFRCALGICDLAATAPPPPSPAASQTVVEEELVAT
jgi:iron(II)-dependent oxidoreductase